jgi:hypothetical protein
MFDGQALRQGDGRCAGNACNSIDVEASGTSAIIKSEAIPDIQKDLA